MRRNFEGLKGMKKEIYGAVMLPENMILFEFSNTIMAELTLNCL